MMEPAHGGRCIRNFIQTESNLTRGRNSLLNLPTQLEHNPAIRSLGQPNLLLGLLKLASSTWSHSGLVHILGTFDDHMPNLGILYFKSRSFSIRLQNIIYLNIYLIIEKTILVADCGRIFDPPTKQPLTAPNRIHCFLTRPCNWEIEFNLTTSGLS